MSFLLNVLFVVMFSLTVTEAVYDIARNDPRHDQCRVIHGQTARSCSTNVYTVNANGNSRGNCGHFDNDATPSKCGMISMNYLCGTLHCTIPGLKDTSDPHFYTIKTKYTARGYQVTVRKSDTDINKDVCFVVTMKGPFDTTRNADGYVKAGTPCSEEIIGGQKVMKKCNDNFLLCSLPDTTKTTTKTTTTIKPTTTRQSTATVKGDTSIGSSTSSGNNGAKAAATVVKSKSPFSNPFFLGLIGLVSVLALIVVVQTVYFIILSRSPTTIKESR